MRPRDEQLLLRLWADMWRDEFSPVVARGSREPDEQTRQDVAAGFRSRVRARLLAGEFEGEDHAMLRRECMGRTPEVIVDVRWVGTPPPRRPEHQPRDPSRLPFIDAELRCRALQHQRWHVRQPWHTSPTSPVAASRAIRGVRADRMVVDDSVRNLPRDSMRAGYDVVSADRRWRASFGGETVAFFTREQAEEWYRNASRGVTDEIHVSYHGPERGPYTVRCWVTGASRTFQSRDDALRFADQMHRMAGGVFPEIEFAPDRRDTFADHRRREIEDRLNHLMEAQAREMLEDRPSTPGLADAIEVFQRRLASASAIPRADQVFRAELLGVWRDHRSSSDDRVDATTYAYQQTAASMRQPDAAERRLRERERMLARAALASADSVSVDRASGDQLTRFAEFMGIARTTDDAPLARCKCGGLLGPAWRKTCDKCASLEVAVNLFIAVVQVIHAACGLGFATGVSAVSHLGATLGVVDSATSTTTIVVPDGYFSYATITYAGVSARRVGRCTMHGVQHANYELYCTRCMLAACQRQHAVNLLTRILAAVGAAWFTSLPGATQRTMLLDVVDRVEPYTGEFADERPARTSLLELGAPEPYVAPPGETAAELASEVDIRGGVRHLLLEME